jgi:preprotein translocase subunit SecA
MLKQMVPLVERVNELAQSYESLSDEQLSAKTDEFRSRLAKDESVDDLMCEAYAVVKDACRRLCGREIDVTGHTLVWDMVPFDVQIVGAIGLHRGCIAEMATGEGKTLVATMPLYLNALTGKNCQLVTVNDYLARRDSEWMGAVFRFLGLTVGCIQNEMRPAERREQYACDITYGTNSEFGFDYLRDMGMAMSKEEMVQRDYYYAIIDEIDSILIDEARTPLIISGPASVSTHRYDQLKPLVAELYRKQSMLSNSLANEAKAVLDNGNATDAEREDAFLKLVKVRLTMPKHRLLMRMLEEPAIRRGLERKDAEIHSDNNRGMLQQVKETLYFAMDERGGEAELSEMGRRFLRPDDPDAFVIPDLPTTFSEIDSDESLDDEARIKARQVAQDQFESQSETIHNISQLLRAYCLFEKDVQYVVQENKVIIVDEFTGRPMPGRRFSEGLHQALEAKEGVTIERETQTLATVTIQNYFRMYDKLAGMTGTAETEATEFKEIYNLDVLVVPTNRPCRRVDADDRVYKTTREKYNAIIEEVAECHRHGQPVLVGTVSVDVSEVLSRMLQRRNIQHNVLNAKKHQSEAEIVARAGQPGAVTIATNMAGRGTDIKLGPGVVYMKRELIEDKGKALSTPLDEQALALVDLPEKPEPGTTFRDLLVEHPCGLHVIGSARHDSRRIDRQLRGRCARQGDPGSSRFYVSLEDNLMRLFGSDRITNFMEKWVGLEEGEDLSHRWLNRSIEQAQRRVEQQHFAIRKRTLQYDDVMNNQRSEIYRLRRNILTCENPREMIFDFVYTAVAERVENAIELAARNEQPDFTTLREWLARVFPIGFPPGLFANADAAALTAAVVDEVDKAYSTMKESREQPEVLRELERMIMLQGIDTLYQEHLYGMDDLRQGVQLRTYGQRDPLVEYKQEAYGLFSELMDAIKDEICNGIFRVHTAATYEGMFSLEDQRTEHAEIGQFGGIPEAGGEPMEADGPPQGVTIRRQQAKVGRNDPCPCGSGKKYKKCCGRFG